MSNHAIGKVVHEAEAHRQHVRIKLPGKVIVRDGSGKTNEFDLGDISAGGFSISAAKSTNGFVLKPGQMYKGDLNLKYDTFSYTIAIGFQARAIRDGRIGCMFQDVGPRESDALRAIIGSFLAGDVLNLNDVLHIVQRDNTVAARKAASADSPAAVKLAATFGTIAVLLLGVLAFSYVFSQVYQLLFVSRATSAVVTTDTIMMRMPEDGSFQNFLKGGEPRLKKGQPMGTFTYVVNGFSSTAPAKTRQITIMSPCECDLLAVPMGDAGIFQKGDPLYQLRTFDSRRWISASITPDAARNLRPGDTVRVSVDALDFARWGRVTTLEASRLDNVQVADTAVRMTVMIDDGIPVEALGLPADVRKHPDIVTTVIKKIEQIKKIEA